MSLVLEFFYINVTEKELIFWENKTVEIWPVIIPTKNYLNNLSNS